MNAGRNDLWSQSAGSGDAGRRTAAGRHPAKHKHSQQGDILNRQVTRFAAITATTFTLVFSGGVALSQLQASAPVAAAASQAPSTPTNGVDTTVQTLLNEREAARQQLIAANSRIQEAVRQIQALQQENAQLRKTIDQQAAALKKANGGTTQTAPAPAVPTTQPRQPAPAAPVVPVRRTDDDD